MRMRWRAIMAPALAFVLVWHRIGAIRSYYKKSLAVICQLFVHQLKAKHQR
jgi:hypothetical protein